MKRSELFFGVLRIPFDAVAVLAAAVLSYRLRAGQIDLIPGIQLLEPAGTLPAVSWYLVSFALPGMIAFVCFAAVLGLYALRTTRSSFTELGRILLATLLWIALIVIWFFFVKKQLFYSRVLLVHTTVFIALFVTIGRVAVIQLQRACLRCGIGVRLVRSIGSLPLLPETADYLGRDPRYRYLGHVATLDQLLCVSERLIDLLIQTDPMLSRAESIAVLEYCRSRHVGYAFLPPMLADVPHQLAMDHIGLTPVLCFRPTPLDGWGRILKRVSDIVGSLVFLVLLSPVFLVATVAILLEDGWPIFYVSRRIGLHGTHHIPVLKFRSMIRNADALKSTLLQNNERQDGPLFKVKHDPRVTRVGRWLRRFDIDEFPQLFNVLAGHMALVGPRPHLPEEVQQYSAYQHRVFAVCPGITGLAQISGRSNLQFEEEVRLDLRYIAEWSLLLDCWILWRSVFVVLQPEHGQQG